MSGLFSLPIQADHEHSTRLAAMPSLLRLAAADRKQNSGPGLKVAHHVLGRMDNTTSPWELDYLAPALAKLAERLKPEESARVCAKAAQHILDRGALVPVLVTLAERLGPDEAAKVAQKVLDRMDIPFLAEALMKLVERCSDQQLVELLKHPRCRGVGRDKVQAALDKRKK